MISGFRQGFRQGFRVTCATRPHLCPVSVTNGVLSSLLDPPETQGLRRELDNRLIMDDHEWSRLWDHITANMKSVKEAVTNLPDNYNLLDFLRRLKLISVEEYAEMLGKRPDEQIEWFLIKILRQTSDRAMYDRFIRALNSSAGTALLRRCFPFKEGVGCKLALSFF